MLLLTQDGEIINLDRMAIIDTASLNVYARQWVSVELSLVVITLRVDATMLLQKFMTNMHMDRMCILCRRINYERLPKTSHPKERTT